jgi:hypothetical protein
MQSDEGRDDARQRSRNRAGARTIPARGSYHGGRTLDVKTSALGTQWHLRQSEREEVSSGAVSTRKCSGS